MGAGRENDNCQAETAKNTSVNANMSETFSKFYIINGLVIINGFLLLLSQLH